MRAGVFLADSVIFQIWPTCAQSFSEVCHKLQLVSMRKCQVRSLFKFACGRSVVQAIVVSSESKSDEMPTDVSRLSSPTWSVHTDFEHGKCVRVPVVLGLLQCYKAESFHWTRDVEQEKSLSVSNKPTERECNIRDWEVCLLSHCWLSAISYSSRTTYKIVISAIQL